MAIDYSALLSADQKKALIEQRVQQFAAEAYQHELNKQVAEKIGDKLSIQQADAALARWHTVVWIVCELVFRASRYEA